MPGTEVPEADEPGAEESGYMGHADIATTMIYVHHVPKVAAADELSRAVAAAMGAETGTPNVTRTPDLDGKPGEPIPARARSGTSISRSAKPFTPHGRYKMLDVNPRVGSNFRQCVGRGGLDAVRAMYLDLCGEPVPADTPDEGRAWWVENYDLRAAMGLRREGSLSLRGWLASVRKVDEPAWFARDDLVPFRRVCLRTARRGIEKALGLGPRNPKTGRPD